MPMSVAVANAGGHARFSMFALLLSLALHRDLGLLPLGEGGTNGEEGPACVPTARFTKQW